MRSLFQAFMRFFFKHLYTTLAWSYDFVAWITSMGQWRRWQQAAIIEFEPGKVLEIGYGPGHLLLDFKRTGGSIIGVDISEQMTRIASRRLRENGISSIIVRARAQELPFAAGAFSGVIATFPSEYILAEETLRSIHRILIAQGKFVVIGLATITGKALYDRFASWLFRITGQAGHPEEAYGKWVDQLRSLCFAARIEIVDQPRAKVLRFIAEKE